MARPLPDLAPAHAAEWRKTTESSRLRENTVKQRGRILKRFMAVLSSYGLVDPGQPLADHVVPETLELYLDADADATPKARFEHVRFLYESMARMLAPERDWAWLYATVKVLKGDANARQPTAPGPALPDRDGVLAAADAHAQAVAADPADPVARRQLRDAALVALIADTAVRIGSVLALRYDTHLRAYPQGWLLNLPGALTKTGRGERHPLGPTAGAVIDRYLAAHPEIAVDTGLWRKAGGEVLAPVSVRNSFQVATARITGTAHGPHAFRYAAASEADAPGAAPKSTRLGHSDPRITDRHYLRRPPAAAAPGTQPVVCPFA